LRDPAGAVISRIATLCLAAWLAFLLPALDGRAQEATPLTPQWHRQADDGSERIRLYLFWSIRCPHCHRALRFLDGLQDELPWLEVVAFELSDPANAATYQAFAEALGVEAAYVPAFFYCGTAFHGYGDDQTTGRYLRETLGACYERIVADAEAATGEMQAPMPPIAIPLLGTIEPQALSLPLMTVVLAGLDAFNPCAFFVLLFLLSLMIHARSRARMALVGGVFVLFSGLLYFLFMAAWLNLFLLVGHLGVVTLVAGAVAILVGLLNVKDYVWLQRGPTLSIPEHAKPGLYQRTRTLIGAANLPAVLLGTVVLALAANTYELLCTAGFPLVFTRILTLHALSTPAYYLYLALYNLIYVLPLLAIVVLFVATLGGRKLKEEEGRVLKLLSGSMMLGLGLVLLVAPESLSQPLVALAVIAAALVLTTVIVALGKLATRMARTSQ
jgi:thiol-disulfide isomerase/thioredoxin